MMSVDAAMEQQNQQQEVMARQHTPEQLRLMEQRRHRGPAPPRTRARTRTDSDRPPRQEKRREVEPEPELEAQRCTRTRTHAKAAHAEAASATASPPMPAQRSPAMAPSTRSPPMTGRSPPLTGRSPPMGKSPPAALRGRSPPTSKSPPMSKSPPFHGFPMVPTYMETSTVMSEVVEPVSIEEVLLFQKWSVHCMSQMYYFQQQELSRYAHELVKFLRDAALLASGKEFGYSVSIRNNKNFVVFHVEEDRNLSRTRARTASRHNKGSNRSSDIMSEMGRDSLLEGLQAGEPKRKGGFVLYFPEPGTIRKPMFQRSSEPKFVLLLRGNEELMLWACQWLQRRFQCVINKHVVRVSRFNMKRLARNWVIEALLDEERAKQMNPEYDGVKEALIINHRNTEKDSIVRDLTQMIPWGSLRRIYESAKEQDVANPAPELIEIAKEQYFNDLPFDASLFEITGFNMEELSLDAEGTVEFYTMSLVHIALHSLMELFSVQKVLGPAKPELTL